jgi:hypothetical protein
MAEIATHTACPIHPEELAVAECDRCGSPLCPRCRVEGVVSNNEFCSDACCDAHEAATTQQFLRGLDHPIVTGWQLWARSLKPLVIHGAPLALLATILVGDAVTGPIDEPVSLSGGAPWALLLLGVYAVALVATVMSKVYTGYVEGNAYLWALRRLLPWAAASALMYAISSLGYLAFIIPGVVLSIRLFWADEFALAHNAGPIRALKESWRLTSGQTGKLFVFQIVAGLAGWLVFMGGAVLFFLIGTIAASLGDQVVLVFFWFMFLLIFVGYGALHGPELARFYGMYAARLQGYDPDAPVRLGLQKRA